MSCLTHTGSVCSRPPSPRGAQAAAGGGHQAQRRQRLRRGTRGRRRGPGGRRGRRRGQTQGRLRALWGSGGAVGTLISAPAQRHARQRCPHGAGHFIGAQAERRVRSGHLVAVGVAHAAHIGRHRWCPCKEQLWHHGRRRLLSSSRGGGGAAGVLEGRAERREHIRDLHRYVMHAWGTGVLRGLYLSSSICGRRRRRPRPP